MKKRFSAWKVIVLAFTCGILVQIIYLFAIHKHRGYLTFSDICGQAFALMFAIVFVITYTLLLKHKNNKKKGKKEANVRG